jgi:hypothetical protein
MAKVTDLTFTQLNDVATQDPDIADNIFSIINNKLVLDIGVLTGDNYSTPEESGICEVMFKLRKLCGEAQIAVNALIATTPAEQLTSFPPFTFGIPSAQGLVGVTQVQTVQLPLMANTVRGSN